ncbi:MAG: 50S ribosomal protein L11 [archaeon]
MPEIKAMIEGGKATAATPLGPALGPLGVNIGKIVEEINAKTKAFAGMKVPVTVKVDSRRNFEIEVGSPPVSALIKKELNLQKASANPKEEVAGNLSIQQAIKIAEMKISNMKSYKIKSALKEVLGTAYSLGVTVENKKPNKVIKEVDAGMYDEMLKEKSN